MNSRFAALNDSQPASIIFGWAAVSIVLAIGLWLRIHFACEPFWVDELHTVWSIDCGIGEVAARAGQGNQTPLYFWLLWTLQSFAGYSDVLLRGVSVTLGTSVMLAVGWLTLRLTRSLTAVIVATSIVAFDPVHLYYASEARPYVLLQLIGSIQIACVVSLVAESGLNRMLGLLLTVATTAMLLLTHVTGLWLIVAELVFIAVTWRSKPRHGLFTAIVLGSLSLAFVSPVMQGAFAKRGDWWDATDITSFVWQAATLAGVLLVPIIFAAVKAITKTSSDDASPTVADAPGLQVALLLAACCLVPFLVVIAAQLFQFAPLASMRYAIVGLVPAAILAGYATHASGTKHTRSFVAIVALTFFAITNPVVQNYWKTGQLAHFRNENWPQAICQIKSHGVINTIFLFANLVEDKRLNTTSETKFVDYLKFPLVSPAAKIPAQYVVPMPTLTGQRWTDKHLQMLTKNETSWLVMRASPALADEIVAELIDRATEQQTNLELVSFEQDRNDIRLVKIRVNDNASATEPPTR